MLASVIDAGPPAVRSGCLSRRAAGRPLVRADVPRRLRAVRRAGQDSGTAKPAYRLASARRRRYAFLRRLWRHSRRPARLRSVLQTALLPRASARGDRALARRNELSRRGFLARGPARPVFAPAAPTPGPGGGVFPPPLAPRPCPRRA